MQLPSPLLAPLDWRKRLADYDEAIADLHYKEGLTYGQIANKTGLSRGQIAGRVYRHLDRNPALRRAKKENSK